MLASLRRTLGSILGHPLNQRNRAQALSVFLRWQLASRLFPRPTIIDFVDHTKLVARRGSNAATANLYCGLFEFSDMAFVMHALRPGDSFADVGANIGAYTVIASGVCGARTSSFEPIPQTFRQLAENIRVNHLESLVTLQNLAVGRGSGHLEFVSDMDSTNRALAPGEQRASTEIVEVRSLDDVYRDQPAPTVIKIDVEGYEAEVVGGAPSVLRSPELKALIVELNGNGSRYGFDEDDVHSALVALGFRPHRYSPFERSLAPEATRNTRGNTLYVRDVAWARERVRAAPSHQVHGQTV